MAAESQRPQHRGCRAHQHGDGLQVDLAAVLVDAVQAAQVLPPHLQQLLRLVTSKQFCLKLKSTPGWLIGASSHSNRLASCTWSVPRPQCDRPTPALHACASASAAIHTSYTSPGIWGSHLLGSKAHGARGLRPAAVGVMPPAGPATRQVDALSR